MEYIDSTQLVGLVSFVEALALAAEKLASDLEEPRSLGALHFRAAARMLADLHLKRSSHIIEIGAIDATGPQLPHFRT